MDIPKFYPTFPKKTPLKENVVGKAREFIDELEENIDYKNAYYAFGIKPEKTFILNSAPGMGKTYCINAFNNSKNKKVTNKLERFVTNKMEAPKSKETLEIKLDDFNIILYEYDIGKYGTAYINVGSKIIQAFFDNVFKLAEKGKPILVAIDECDSLFTSRKSNIHTHSEDRKVLDTLMKNVQISHDTPDIYMVMMTNLIEEIDEASIRAGRIDKRINFDLPNFDERKIGYRNAIIQANERADYNIIRSYHLDPLAELSDGFNYADIFQTVDNALRNKVKELLRAKDDKLLSVGYIKQASLEKAIKKHKKEFKDKLNKKKIGFI
jgi:SpoVK/Ycf46/Vps4 family AAA+-type ATPase